MSQLPGKCCAAGHMHSGLPTGHTETLHDLPAYVAEPPSGRQPKGVVVIIPDAFGWELPNLRVLADTYAREGGFRVVMPDLMDGESGRIGRTAEIGPRDSTRTDRQRRR